MAAPGSDMLRGTRRPGAGPVALRFILTCIAVFGAAFTVSGILLRLLPPVRTAAETAFPAAFWVTTGLLAVGSVAMHLAVHKVRREKQAAFRRCLRVAATAGALFLTLQTYGIAGLVRNQRPDAAQLGVNAFATALTALHAMHFTLAMMLLIWVTLQAHADRYDHEYYWGVSLCSWFWHALGIVWTAILVVFAFAV
jgi:cytochrome c oxidase subunit 3